MKKLILSTALLAAICTAGQAQEKNDYYVKHVEFPQGATLEQKVDMAGTSCTYSAAIGMAADGVDCFPAFWYQYFHRT